MKAYKLFRIKNNQLYPLYVLADKPTPMNEWLDAEEGIRTEDGKVKSKLGRLAYRPGWHVTTVPFTDWIGKKMPDGTLAQKPDTVWCEVEYSADINYNDEARENGWRNGRWAAQRAYLKHIPENGYYFYRTNSKQVDPWIICGRIKVTKILTHEEVKAICNEHGIEAQEVA